LCGRLLGQFTSITDYGSASVSARQSGKAVNFIKCSRNAMSTEGVSSAPRQEDPEKRKESGRLPQWFRAFDIGRLKDWLSVIAILLGGTWAVYTLGAKNYREDYLYRGKSVAVQPSCRMLIAGETSDFYLVHISLSLSSAARIRFFVFDSPYQLAAVRLQPINARVSLEEFYETANKKFADGKPFQESPRAAPPQLIPIELGRIWQSGSYLEPNEKFEDTLLTTVSKKTFATFDALQFSANLVLTGDPGTIGSQSKINKEGDLETSIIIYPKPKSDYLALADTDQRGTMITSTHIFNPQNQSMLQDSNTAINRVSCLFVPNKSSTTSLAASK
jgi:hypothetical protein